MAREPAAVAAQPVDLLRYARRREWDPNADDVRGRSHFRPSQLHFPDEAPAFTPAVPVASPARFAERRSQMDQLIGVISQPGRHGIVYGERGAGKTSFSAVVAAMYRSTMLPVRTNCASGESFAVIWRHVFEGIVAATAERMARHPRQSVMREVAEQMLHGSDYSPEHVQQALGAASESIPIVVFIDEFDRVTSPRTRRKFADTIKALSDYAVKATIVLVGVADSMMELVAEHESITRNLVSIHIGRMNARESGEVLDKGFLAVGMKIEDGCRERIIALSCGVPHYLHLLGLASARSALLDGRDVVVLDDVDSAVAAATREAHDYVVRMYQTALGRSSSAKFEMVLVAAALVAVDDLGYFAPRDLCEPMAQFMHRPVRPVNFISNLNSLVDDGRGNALHRSAQPGGPRYRFRDPLLQPYVLLKGIEHKLVEFGPGRD